MDGRSTVDILLFDDFRFDRREGVLFRLDRAGAAEPIALGSRALGLLGLLVERQGELVSKDAIMEAVWPGRVVEEANLNVQISKLRHILDHCREEGSCIQTIAGHGYRFVAPVKHADAAAPGASAAIPQTPALVRPRLSIVVLPFANISEDREQQYLADGITEDLTTDLSRIEDMLVISRNTAFTYRNKPVDTKQIGRELGVRYVLEGSVRRSGSQIRVNAELIDAETDAHLWAERFDCETGDLFALQNDITSRIAAALDLELVLAEAARPTDHPDALDYILRGRAAILSRPPGRDNCAEAIGLFERALALDPRSAEAQSWLAIALIHRVPDDASDLAMADIARAERLAEEALAVSPRSPLAHYAKGQVMRARRRPEDAIPVIRDGDRAQFQPGVGYDQSRMVQISDRVCGGGNPPPRASHPPQSARSADRCLVWPDWPGAPAAIAHRRGDPLARKGAQRQSGTTLYSHSPSRSLCPQRRYRTRRCRTR
jgi:TolB-like protein